jgi:hypothetical protein
MSVSILQKTGSSMTAIKYGMFLLFAVVSAAVHAADYYVATNGSDAASGAIGAPFKTITYAVTQMGAGDTCFIRGGTYHEVVSFSGKNNLTFTAYPGETVTMDGTVEISSGWTLHSGNIYKTTLAENVWQLFADGEMMMPARWPNAFLHDSTVWDQPNHWGRINHNANTTTSMVDTPTGHSNLSALPFSVVDAMAVLNVGSFKSYTRKVNTHAAGSGTFTVDAVGSLKSSLQYYFLEGKLEFLDAEREWYFNPTTKELYFWGDTNAVIRGKVQDYAFHVTNSDDITIRGINFFGTTVYFTGCERALVEKGTFDYPSCTKRMLGEHSVAPATTTFWGGSNNTFFDNTMRYADTHAIFMNNGTDNLIENCLFEYIDWSAADLPNLMGTVYMRGSGSIYRGNTAHTTGASEFMDVSAALTAEFNQISNIGMVQNDGAMIQLTVGAQPNSVTAYNWFFDSDKYGARFDASTTVGSPTGTDGLMHHNVGFNIKSTIMQKGDYHACYNNTSLDSENNGIIILVDDVSDSIGTVVRNNAAEKLSSARTGSTPLSSNSDHSHNWNGYENGNADMRTVLRDPDNLDFRPIPNSVLVDGGTNIVGITEGYAGTAPDMGAYEHGAADYWIAGRRETGASTAIPPNGSATAKASASLIWHKGLDSLSSDIYLGTSSNAVAAATTASPEFRINQVNNIHDPLGLFAQTYFWRIDEHTATGTVKGAVWSFAVPTATAVAPGIENTPAENITGASATIGGTITDGGTGSKVWISWWPAGGGTNEVYLGVQAGTFSTNLAGLLGNTRYSYRGRAENSYGSSWAPTIADFIIGVREEPPEVVNTPALNVTASSATIGGQIANDVAVSSVWIHWWPAGGVTNGIDMGHQTAGFSTNLSGLAAHTLYSYRCLATNAYGSNWAPADASFYTLAAVGTNWVELSYDDFESGWGNFTSGGADAYLHSGAEAHQGFFSVGTRDNNGGVSSFYHTAGIDVHTPGYTQVKLEFWFYPWSMDVPGLDNFFVQYFDGTDWLTLRDYVSGVDFTNGIFQFEEFILDESGYALPTDMKIRFMCDGNGAGDYVYFDEVRVSALAAVAEQASYGQWGSDYGLSGADTYYLADPDGDGLNNLAEYGLGGIPTNGSIDTAILPTFGNIADGGTNGMEYVYRRRTDAAARHLDYHLELSTNLVSNGWNTNGYSETGSAPLETGFEAVTNRLSTESQTNQFIRLRISIE